MRRSPLLGLVAVVLVTTLPGCRRSTQPDFTRQLDLAIRAGKDQLSADDVEGLTRSNDPLLLQSRDPDTSRLLALFANLPAESHRELLRDGYLKWRFTRLDPARRQAWRDLVQVNVDAAARRGAAPNPDVSQAALERAQVGFAVVEIPEAKARVVSWYILWAEGPPTWVTVVGARAAGSQAYFSAHLLQLPDLRRKPESRPPS